MKTLRFSKNKITTRPLVRVSYALSSIIFLAGSLILIAISIGRPATFDTLRLSLMDAATPLISTVNTPIRAASDFVKDASGLATLQADNARLQAENAKLKEWYLAARTLQSENAQLQKLVNLQPAAGHEKIITAGLLTDTGSPFAKSIIVHAGTQKGVAKGAAVISSQGVIGRVIEVGETSSRILLLSDMNSRIPVTIDYDGSAIHAILAGQNDAAPVLLHISAGTNIPAGAHIMTSGLGGLYPKGLPVGVTSATGHTVSPI